MPLLLGQFHLESTILLLHHLQVFTQKVSLKLSSLLHIYTTIWASLMGQWVKNLPAMQETCRRPRFNPWVRKIPWRRKRQPIPVFLPRKIPQTEEPGRLQSMGLQRVRHDWVTKHTHIKNKQLIKTYCIAQGILLNTLLWVIFKKNAYAHVYIQLIHSAVHPKLTQHCKSTTLQ